MRYAVLRALAAIALALALAAAAPPARAQAVTVIEYYNVALDHYFITSLQPDIDALDSGHFFGWSRTGLSFQAFADQASGGPGANPVCRFYIPPPADSHFFSASPAECAAVLAKILTDPNYRGFVYETPNAFYIAVPDATGACPAGTIPVYRLWNQRADSNHRYTTDPAIKALMLAKGYIGEGSGPDAVAMCTPGAAKGDTTVRVTGFSSFVPGCDGIPATGLLYRGAEVEPMLARNPADPNHLIGVWQQDRWSNGGAAGHGTGVSFDGGRTWTRTQAALSRCTGGNAANGGDYPRVSDPWVTIAPDGAAYQIAIAFAGGVLQSDSFGAVLVSRSADGGRSWGAATTLIRDGSTAFNDKESITADPTNASFVYATWERFVGSEQGPAPTWFARTTDSGATWEPARQVYDPGGTTNSTLNNQVIVLPDGVLLLFFSEFDEAGNQTTVLLRVIRSQDKGATWSAPITIAQSQSRGTRNPETGTPIRDGSNVASIAVDKSGALAIVWQDSRFSGGARDGIALSRSFDGGLTWSAPVGINSVPSVQALLPAVTIRGDGLIGVTYYDFRNHAPGAPTLLTDYWLTTSTDGVNWNESHVAGPFDFATAPFALGLFLGDYQALTSIENTFVPFYVTTNANSPTNLTDVFATLLTTSIPVPVTETAKAGPPSRRALAAPALAMTPELQQILSDAARRTLQRRFPGRDALVP
jgi:hypothetical protein